MAFLRVVFGLLIQVFLHGSIHIQRTGAAIAADEVTALPGYSGALPSKQYSGYLDIPNSAPNTRHYHYWLVLSENDPSTDPIVFWFNGGPGASSLLGYFVEIGPFNVNHDSVTYNTTSVPLLFYNEYSWSKRSNLVFLESPAGVGYSYCDGSEGPINSCCNWNDTNVAQDNHAILQIFFDNYPEFIEHQFFIIGESYAGVYVPTLVMQIELDPSRMPPLIGFGIGDGCLGLGNQGACGIDSRYLFWQFMYGHGQLSTHEYHHITNVCGSSLHYGNETQQCLNVMSQAHANLGGFNVYAMYDMCYLENDQVYSDSARQPQRLFGGVSAKLGFNSMQKVRYNLEDYPFYAKAETATATATETPGNNEYKCGGWTVTDIYLNQESVKKALHVPANVTWQWQDGNWDKYSVTQASMIPNYVDWVKKYRVLIYFGDTDAGVPYQGGEEWTAKLGYPTKESWRPWTTDGKQMMGGFVQIYETGTNFTYVVVRGAGHMVPQYKPNEALFVYNTWLQNGAYPGYN